MPPTVTYLLLAHNQEAFVADAVASAFAQTWSPLEIVISDDASTDRTGERLEHLVAGYRGPHRLTLLRQPRHLGLCRHLQAAVEQTHGEYLILAAADDISLSDRVERVVEAIERHGPLGAVFGRYHVFRDRPGEPRQWRPESMTAPWVAPPGSLRWLDALESDAGFHLPGCAAAWHRSLFEDCDPLPAQSNAEDVILRHRLFASGRGFVILPAPMVWYRVHGKNIHAGRPPPDFFREAMVAYATAYVETARRANVVAAPYSAAEWNRYLRYLESELQAVLTAARLPRLERLRAEWLVRLGCRWPKPMRRQWIAKLRQWAAALKRRSDPGEQRNG